MSFLPIVQDKVTGFSIECVGGGSGLALRLGVAHYGSVISEYWEVRLFK